MDQGIFLAIIIPTTTVLAGMLVNNRQIDALRRELSAKIDGVDGRIDGVHGRVDSLRNEIVGLRNEFGSEIRGLRNEMNARFEAQTQALLRVEQVLDARLQHLEERYR